MRSRTLLRLLVALIAVAVAGNRAGVLPGSGGDAPAAGTARVVRVVDGDTIKVRTSSGNDTVRYIGVDTPESVKPGVPVQCFAKAASHYNERLVDQQRVRLVQGTEPRDRYGRLLAYVYRLDDGAFVNAELVRRGYARTLTIAPNDRYAPRFAALERRARSAGRGLWAACPGAAQGAG